MSVFVAIPVKTLMDSKTRLLNVLKPEECQSLTLAMLEDVLKVLKQSSAVNRIAVISSDIKVQEFTINSGVIHILEKKRGLNQAVDQAIHWCLQKEAESILILPADIPLIKPSDVEEMIVLGSDDVSITIAPSQRGGTSALLLRPPNLIQTCFGPNSFKRHLVRALKKKIRIKVYHSKSLAMDIDFPEDLENLVETDAQTMSHQFFRQIKLDKRLKRQSQNRQRAPCR